MISLGVERFFAAIKDGEWHGIDGLSDELRLQVDKLVEFSRLLASHGIARFDEKSLKLRVKPMWRLLLPEEEDFEPKTTVATFIIPPNTSINVQSTQFSNINNVEIEVSLRFTGAIEEVAIRV